MGARGARYRFGPLERRGLIAGWRGGQIASVAVGSVTAVLMLRRGPGVATIAEAVAVVAVAVAFAWWPIGGRTAEQWLPTVARWGASGLSSGPRSGATSTVPAAPGERAPGRRAPSPVVRRRPGVERSGHRVAPDGRISISGATGKTGMTGVPGAMGIPGTRRTAHDVRPGSRAGVFGSLRLLTYDPGSGTPSMGVVHDSAMRTYTAVMVLRGHSFALLGADEKERRVSSWASVLSSLSRERSAVHRLQWIASTEPDDGAAVRQHLAEHAAVAHDFLARRSYETLLSSTGTETCRHDVHLALQLRAAGAAGRAMRSLGGGPRAACAVLSHEVASLRRLLSDADAPVEAVLDDRALASVVRRRFDASPSGSGAPCSPTPSWPWPLVTEARWSTVRADAAWHSTYWIAEWPRVDVGPEFLGPLLLGTTRRALSVVMEPLSPSRAVREAERARTADIADAELRRRGGFLATARRHREAELADRREEELADGHSSFRFSGYVTVSAATREQLETACGETEQAASQCRLELRRLYGDQERALACSLPLARGLD